MADSDEIKLERVRLSFPDIWKAKSIKPGDEPKFSASLLLDKEAHAAEIKHLKAIIWGLAISALGGKEKAIEVIKKGNIALHEGSDKTYDGYGEHNMYLTASTTRRPAVIDRDRTPLAEDDRKPYPGCYVNAVVRVWPMNNNFGKRINCELLGIQFVADGEPFGPSPFNPDDHFENLEEDDQKPAEKKSASNESAKDDDEIPF